MSDRPLDDLHNLVKYDALLRQVAALRDAGVQSPLPFFRDLTEILVLNGGCYSSRSGIFGNPHVLREAFILADPEEVFNGNSLIEDVEDGEEFEELAEGQTIQDYLVATFMGRLEAVTEDDPDYGPGFTISTEAGDFTFHFDADAFYDEMWFLTVTEAGDTRPLAWSTGWQHVL